MAFPLPNQPPSHAPIQIAASNGFDIARPSDSLTPWLPFLLSRADLCSTHPAIALEEESQGKVVVEKKKRSITFVTGGKAVNFLLAFIRIHDSLYSVLQVSSSVGHHHTRWKKRLNRAIWQCLRLKFDGSGL